MKTKEFQINSITVNGVKYDIVDDEEINCEICDLLNDYATNKGDDCPMCKHCFSLFGLEKIFKKYN
jgi:translation elongation factor EF-Tu-like GTPase